jgi:LysR family transcriptional regulator of beta-lactamase
VIRPHLPLNALRAFEGAARHLSFTNAAIELCVTPAALSHQVKALEERLGMRLFRRLPRGLALTDEGHALLPVLRDAFDRIADALERFQGGVMREVLTVGAVGTFAVGWLLPRIASFHEVHPFVDLRLSTNNNRVDIAAEGLDYAIRFGEGAWHGTEALLLFHVPFTPLCSPAVAARLAEPSDLCRETLLRSYRSDEWSQWFSAAGVHPPTLRGPVFDSSRVMIEATLQGAGVALAPVQMFGRELREGQLVRPFTQEVVGGAYWLTRLKSRERTAAMAAFEEWISEEAKTDLAR